jgi:hypothetical protein
MDTHEMKLDEKTLAAALVTKSGGAIGQHVLDEIRKGNAVVIQMEDGSKIVLTTVAEAIQTLIDRFHWEPPIKWTDDNTAAYVLGVCQRLEGRFTLTEIVARILMERPLSVVEFPSAWGRLIKHKFVCRIRQADPSLYELTPGHEWP